MLIGYWVVLLVKVFVMGMLVVIVLYGCSGFYMQVGVDVKVLGLWYCGYVQWLGVCGYVVVFLDSFGLCGKLYGICIECIVMCDINGVVCCVDVLVMMCWVVVQLGVDVNCIVLFGWFNGVQVVLEVVDVSCVWFVDMFVVNCVVVFYLGCVLVQKWFDYWLNVLLLLLVGGNDDWILVDYCQVFQIVVLVCQLQVCFELDMFGGVYYGFDGMVVVKECNGILKGCCYGMVMVGGDLVVCEVVFVKFVVWFDVLYF